MIYQPLCQEVRHGGIWIAFGEGNKAWTQSSF